MALAPSNPDIQWAKSAFGALWIAGAFASLFYCFATNYIKKPIVPAEELAIANAALSPAADHHATP